MAKATHTPNTSRRRLLSGSAALSLAAGAAGLAVCDPLPALAVEGDDALLISLCHEVCALHKQGAALYAAMEGLSPDEVLTTEDATDDAWHALREQQVALVARICVMPSRTLAGERALAECFACIDSGNLREGSRESLDTRILLALARAVAGRA